MTRKEKQTVSDTDRSAYRCFTSVELRYGDTDRQGHINNAVYCTLFESGRCEFLYENGQFISGPGRAFVIVKLSLDYLSEMNYPGACEIGSKVLSLGKSSMVVGQAIFKDGVCASTAESVIVLTDETTRKSTPLTDEIIEKLKPYM